MIKGLFIIYAHITRHDKTTSDWKNVMCVSATRRDNNGPCRRYLALPAHSRQGPISFAVVS